MANSLSQTLQMNQALQQQLGTQQQISDALGSQLGASQQLIDHVQQLASQATNAGGSIQQFGSTNQSVMQQVMAAWSSANGGVAGFFAGLKAGLGRIPLVGTTILATLDIVSDAFKGIGEIAQSTASTIEQLFSSAFNVAKSIFGIEGRIVSGLISMSNEFAAAASEYMQALENLRKQLGAFDQQPAANVIKSMREMSGQLANTGLSVWRVFGNNAKQLEYFTELAVGMGPAWDMFGTEIANSAEVMGTFAKGMGLSAEEMKNFAGLAASSGRTLTDVLQDAANYSLQLGPQFGLSAKVISRDVGKMIGNVTKFGNMTVKQMTESAIYTRKLGLEMDKIVGIVDKFDNFETAAESASQLSQAFGLNLDAFKLMEEQDPAKRIDMIRKAMQQAGRSTENMTRQELALLSAQTGLDEASARQAFSLQNVGSSYDQIAKAGDDAQASQLTQAEATAKLADAIERMVVTGKQFSSFWEALVQGFADGIVKFGPMRTLMFEIHRALQRVYWAGVKMGQAFANFFPGIKDGIKGLSKYFSAFNELITPLSNKFVQFMKDISSLDPSQIKDKTVNFLHDLSDNVTGFFSTQSAGRNMFIRGMMKAMTTFVAALPGVFTVMIEGLREQILQLPTYIVNFMTGASASLAAGGGDTLAGAFGQMLRVGFEALKDIGGMLLTLMQDPVVQANLKISARMLWDGFVTFAIPAISAAWTALSPAMADAAATFMGVAGPIIWDLFLGAVKLAFTAGTALIIAAIAAPFYLAWEGLRAIFSPSNSSSLGLMLLDGLRIGLSGIGDVFIAAGQGALDGIKMVFDLHSPSRVFADIGTNLLAGLSQGLSNATDVVTAPFKGAVAAISGLMGGEAGGVDNTIAGMQARLASMEDLSSRVSILKSSFSSDIAAVITEMVKQANDLDEAMSTVGDISISTGLEKVGKALGIDNKRFTIDNKGFSINVNLSVTMDAKELATVLTQKNLLDDNKSIQVG